jgi:hypothetical protein
MPSPFTLAFEILNLREILGSFRSIGDTIQRADKSVSGIAATIRSTGGSANDVGAVGGFARLSGQDPNQAGNLARGLRERIAGSPLAQGVFGQGVLPSGSGQIVNEAKLYRRVVEQIVFARTDEEARIKAQIVGMENLLPLRDADRRLIEETIRAAEHRARLVDADFRKERANYQALRTLREEAVDSLGIAIERRLLPAMQGAEEAVGSVAKAAEGIVSDPGGIARQIGKGLKKAFSDPASLGPIPRSIAGVTPKSGAAASPTEKNTQAMQDLTLELVALKKEFLNDRGGRAAGAVPKGLRGKALDKYLETAARDLGAVSF